MSEYDELLDTGATEETPPDPGLLVVKGAFGPGTWSVRFADGTPFGQYISDHDLSPEEVEAFLREQGMGEDVIDFFVRNRRKGREANEQLAANPTMQAFAANEAAHDSKMETFRAEMLKRMKK